MSHAHPNTPNPRSRYLEANCRFIQSGRWGGGNWSYLLPSGGEEFNLNYIKFDAFDLKTKNLRNMVRQSKGGSVTAGCDEWRLFERHLFRLPQEAALLGEKVETGDHVGKHQIQILRNQKKKSLHSLEDFLHIHSNMRYAYYINIRYVHMQEVPAAPKPSRLPASEHRWEWCTTRTFDATCNAWEVTYGFRFLFVAHHISCLGKIKSGFLQTLASSKQNVFFFSDHVLVIVLPVQW